jgi:UPF0716 protein FxsA
MLGDGFLLVVAAQRYGVYRTLGIVASVGLAGMLVALGAIDATLVKLKDKVSRGVYPRREFAQLAALIVAGVFVIIPGFLTDAVAALLYLPPFRGLIGALIVRPLRHRLKDAYEHLKLAE